MRLVIGLDRSSYSQTVCDFVGSLFACAELEISALSALSEPPFFGTNMLLSTSLNLAEGEVWEDQAEAQAVKDSLERATEVLVAQGASLDHLVVSGDLSAGMIKACRDTQAQLAVLGFGEGFSGPEGLLDTVAQRLLEAAPCPTLLVRGKEFETARIVVPVDGSIHAAETVEFLLQAPLRIPMEILLVTVAKTPTRALAGVGPGANMRKEDRREESRSLREEATERQLVETWERLREAGHRPSEIVTCGDVCGEILRAAHQNMADLIALGAKGITDDPDCVLGSVAHRVARQAKCSVLVGRYPRLVGDRS